MVGIMVGFLCGEMLLLPAALKPIVVPLGALVLCVLMAFPFPAIRKGTSIELRTRMITLVALLSTGVESSALTGGKLLEPLSMAALIAGLLALSLLCLVKLEPMVYRFLGGKAGGSDS
jgi:hypothetical protein